MSAVGEAKPLIDSEVSFYEKNRTTLCEVGAAIGLALGLVGLGVMIAGMATSSHWFYTFSATGSNSNGLPVYRGDDCYYDYYSNGLDNIPVNLDNGHQIQNLCQSGAQVGAVGMAAFITGSAVFGVMFALRYFSKKKDAEREKMQVAPTASETLKDDVSEAKTNKKAYLMMGVGAIVALFAIGMIIGAGAIKDHGVSEMQKLIEQGKEANNLPSYDPHFWDHLEANWLKPTDTNMTGILSGLPFVVLAGSGLFGVGLLTRTGAGCFFGCKKQFAGREENKEQEDNDI